MKRQRQLSKNSTVPTWKAVPSKSTKPVPVKIARVAVVAVAAMSVAAAVAEAIAAVAVADTEAAAVVAEATVTVVIAAATKPVYTANLTRAPDGRPFFLHQLRRDFVGEQTPARREADTWSVIFEQFLAA